MSANVEQRHSDFLRATLYSFDDGTEPFVHSARIPGSTPAVSDISATPRGIERQLLTCARKIQAAKYYERHVSQPIDRKSERKRMEEERVVIYAGLNTRHRMEVVERINGRRGLVESEALHSLMLLARPPR